MPRVAMHAALGALAIHKFASAEKLMAFHATGICRALSRSVLPIRIVLDDFRPWARDADVVGKATEKLLIFADFAHARCA